MVTRTFAGIGLVAGVALGAACGPAPMDGEPAGHEVAAAEAPSSTSSDIAEVVGQLRDMAWAGQVDEARELIEAQRPHHDTGVP